MTRLILSLILLASAAYGQAFGSANANRIRGRNVDPAAPTNLQALLWKCAVPTVVFTGTGLNDATSGGTCTAATASLYEVVIDSSAASPDTFKWRKDGGSWTAGVSMTGAAQTLADGVTITFKATDGHTLADAWAFETTVSWTPSAVAGGAGGVASVAEGGTGLTAGVAGGIPYYPSTSTMASSTLLTLNSLVQGGGSGGAPVSVSHSVNPQTGTTYAIVTGDRYKLVTLTNGAAIAVSIAAAGSAGFPDGWETTVLNSGVGTVTITPTTSTIEGAAALVLTTGQSARIVSNGTNYRAMRTRHNLVSADIPNNAADTSGKAATAGNADTVTNGVTGTGTTNYLPKYTNGAAGVIGNSAVSDDGTTVSAARTLSFNPGGTVPAWAKYSLVAIANGVNGCANANGCWQVNGVLGAIKTAGLTQDVVLVALPAKWHVTDWSAKTAVVCIGATTALSGMGVTSNTTLFRAATYDIAAAVSDTNLTTGPTAGAGANTAAGTNLIASLITTVQNVDQLVVGCAVDYTVLWGVKP